MGVNKRLIGAGAAGSASPFPGQNFKHITYTGDDSTGKAITGVGFKPDLILIKPRNQTENWNAYDTTRGATKQLVPNAQAASTTQGNTVQSFDSDGFTLNNDNNVNKSGINYSAWCWKANGGTTSSNSNGSITSTVQANTAAGFSIVQWTGTGSNATIGHGLSSAPEWLVVKKTNASGTDWVWKNDVQLGAARGLYLNEDVGEQTDSTFWQSASPTSTVFSVGTSDKTNGSGNTYIAYCWHSVAGFSNSTTGSQYIGTGDSDGPTVTLGFEPSIIIIKSKDGSPTTDWKIYTKDTNEHLSINTTGQAGTNSGNEKIEFLSNGFKISGNGADINASGQSYNYYAYAADPDTEAPTLASSFNIETYIGTGASRSITGLGFGPGFVWIKHRDGTGSHSWTDVVRGDDLVLQSNENEAEASGQINLDSDGFTIRNDNALRNSNGASYVAWNWKADDNEPTINSNGSVTSITSVNDNAGFSVVKATAPSSGVFTVGHGLSSALDFFVIKRRDSTGGWIVYSRDTGANKYLLLNSSAAAATDTNFFDNTHPTSTVFTLNAGQSIVGGADFVAYCFANVTGYQKFGSYTGTGSSNSLTTGFKPDFLIVKETDGVDSWEMYDSLRGSNKVVYPNGNNAEVTGSTLTSFDSNGFTVSSATSINESGKTYIYWAVAKNVPSNTTLANSFKAVTYTGTGSANTISGLGFSPDLVWLKHRNNPTAHQHNLLDTVRTNGFTLHSNSSDAAESAGTNMITAYTSDGFTLGTDNAVNQSGINHVAWAWKAGNTWQSNLNGAIPSIVNANTANGFSIVKYTATGSTATVGHGLSSAPDLIIGKTTNQSYDWLVYHTSLGNANAVSLQSNAASASNSFMNSTSPTSSVFTAGAGNNLNYADGNEIIAYCFHAVAGYSKFGSYSGSGSDGNAVSLGFQPDFVMIKRTNDTGGWLMFDSARNTSNPRNNRLEADNTSAETTGSATKFLDFNSTDFEANGSDTEVNASGSTYLYIAFKMN